jgi:hypothetical protein
MRLTAHGFDVRHGLRAPLERSRQWRAFQALVERLHDRGARLTVIVGPLSDPP